MPNYFVSVTRIQPAPAVSAVSGNLASKVDFKVESLPSHSARFLKDAGAMDKTTDNCEYLFALGGLAVNAAEDASLEEIVNEALKQAQVKREAVE